MTFGRLPSDGASFSFAHMSADGHQPEERTRGSVDDEVGYGVREVAGLFALAEHRLRYWSQTGFFVPSLRLVGRGLYSFRVLVVIILDMAVV